jgi:hypothetical protein
MPNISETHPELCNEWHPTKNGQLVPASVSYGSVRKVWWLGDCSHEWEAVIQSRTSGTGCPFCSGRKVLSGFNDIGTTHPELASEWHPSKNNALSLGNLSAGSHKKVWWLGDCSHEWEATVANRAFAGSSCPYCSRSKVLTEFNDLLTTHADIASEWHPSKNGSLSPQSILSGSHKKVWWLGPCGHEWSTSPKSRTSNGAGCPICSSNKTLIGFNDFLSKHPKLEAEWNYKKNVISPNNLTSGSSIQVWWICGNGHEWKNSVASRIRGRGCPYCANKQVLCGYNDIATTHPTISAEWNYKRNTPLLPTSVTYGHGQAVWWICAKGHEWLVAPYNRVFYKTACPECASKIFVSKAENEIAQWLVREGIKVEQSKRKLVFKRELDIYLPDHNVAIEYNGVYWHSEKAGRDKNYHYSKFRAAKNAGINLIQIWEDEWNRNPEQIKSMLLHKLGKSTQEKIYAHNTSVVALSKAEAETFLATNHIHGFEEGTYYLGLKAMKTNEVSAVLVLRQDGGDILTILRYATSRTVADGFSKLLAYAEEEYSPDKFIALSDNCVSDGKLYQNSGFVVDEELDPDYMYVFHAERRHRSDYGLDRFRDDPALQWVDGMNESELADLNNFNRIWDAGKIRWMKCRNEMRQDY